MISYACSPKRGGEHLLGWNWAYRLANKGHRVVVLTAEHRLSESDGKRPPTLEMIGVDERKFAFLRKLGLFGRHIYYQLWNRAAAQTAKRIIDRAAIDIIHQCTFHTFRMPCIPALWGIKPTIWGPVAGLERIPRPLFFSLGWHMWAELLRYHSCR